jgi:hypothetical protein
MVSPILENSHWRDQVHDIFMALRQVCTVTGNDSCGMHVHVSQGEGKWELKDLQAISRSIIYFECAIDVLLPVARRNTPAAPRNSWVSASLQEKSLTDCWDCINGCKTTDDLVEVMNNTFKYSAWNFCPLLSFRGGRYNAKRTIEFRRAPWVTRADECLAWVDFVVAFIHASIFTKANLGGYMLREYTRDVSGLFQYITSVPLPGCNRESLERLFEGRHGSVIPVTPYDP